MSNLSAFIRANGERILLEWETFARALPVGESMNVGALRDHAQAMLEVIATDLDQPQTALQQSEKARGLEPAQPQTSSTAATEHGSGRAASGFTVAQMVAEFRALRASVVRLWTAQREVLSPADIEDLIRFNEAIDQAVAESLERYSTEIDETRERFLAILGHDLRNPLGAIGTSTAFLLETDVTAEERGSLIRGIDNAARRMTRLVSDLLDLALSRLGDAMPITRTEGGVGAIVREVAAEVSASYPKARIATSLSGDLSGSWDIPRLTQALTNLVANAVQHGDIHAPVTIDAKGDEDAVVIEVHNAGPPIAAEALPGIFGGMKRGKNERADRRHLGLGLFIVDKIIAAHDGTLDVRSTADEGTTFTIRLPKSASAGSR